MIASAGLILKPEQRDTPDPIKLHELASWYREFAERAGNPAIWESRVRTADDLDAEAERIECRRVAPARSRHPG
jgi:hypothetical protein